VVEVELVSQAVEVIPAAPEEIVQQEQEPATISVQTPKPCPTIIRQVSPRLSEAKAQTPLPKKKASEARMDVKVPKKKRSIRNPGSAVKTLERQQIQYASFYSCIPPPVRWK